MSKLIFELEKILHITHYKHFNKIINLYEQIIISVA